MSRNYPFHPPSRGQRNAAMAGHIEAKSAARSNTDRRPPSGFGILLEVMNDRIVGAVHVEQSPVLRPEAEIEINVGNTSRRGMSLVEAYGVGPAPSGNLRHGADLYVVDQETAAFVVDAIREKVADGEAADMQMKGVWHPGLQCCVVAVNYDWSELTGQVHLESGDCCDMAGAIALFTAIDPNVSFIQTFSGVEADTAYVKRDGQWQAIACDTHQ